ncbi:MAG: hypothetical protein F3742_12310, partial [Nitrospinae bacterium]|nr:hypothetical protein [Nitrospinota bacterium]
MSSEIVINTLDYLKKIDFLKNLSGLEDLSKTCKQGLYPKDSFLFKENEVGENLIIVTSGHLDIFKENRLIAKRSIGEMALLGNQI